jgi:thioredoxin reductase (NADPH)
MQNKKVFLIFLVCVNFLAGCNRTQKVSQAAVAIDIPNATTLTNVMPLVIMGSGPAALGAGLYGGRQKIPTLLIAGNEPGGALTKTTYVDNWLGRPHILGPDLITELRSHAMQFGAFIMNDAIEKVDFTRWPFVIKTEGGKIINAFSVIIATGSTPRVLGVKGEKTYWGKGVTTCALCDAPYFKGKEVVVVGGGDSAAEEAMQLAPYAQKITLLVRGESMRAAAVMQERLKEYPHIYIKYNTEVRTINGNGSHVTSIDIYNNKTNQTETMNVSGVFLAIGHDPNTSLFKGQLALDDRGYIIMADRTQRTTIPGIFAAGDVQDPRYRQAGVAAGDGIKAAIDAAEFLQHYGFSTDVAQKLEPNLFNPLMVQEGTLKVEPIALVSDFERILKDTEGLVVLDFYAPYCPSCMQMLPMIESVAYQFAEQVLFLKVDTSKTSDLAEKYKVLNVPCMLIFKDGQLVARYNKALTRKELVELLQKFF